MTSPTKQRNGQYLYTRKLLAQGRNDDAAAYAEKCGFTLADLPAVAGAPMELDRVETTPPNDLMKAEFAVAVAEDDTRPLAAAELNGWPTETTAVIWRRCPNPRLWTIKLDDGRLCSMTRTQRNWALNTRVQVRLVKAEGEACYEAYGFSRPAF